jgi:uncharacterized protein YecE (DUF72 family)
MAMAIRVGTSGWVYLHWRRRFYPQDLPAGRWLAYYAERFATVEINNTFYRLPPGEAVARWRAETPLGFLFACKGSRFISHMKRLTDVEEALVRYYERIDRLAGKRGPILWQLPPQFLPDPGRLDAFLAAQPAGTRQVLEFRNVGWYTSEALRVLERHGAALCEHDLVDGPVPRPTGGFRSLRFHGRTAPYRGRYGRDRLRGVARDLRAFARQGGQAFVYFNNDSLGHALSDARDLEDALGDAAYLLPRGTESAEEAREARSWTRSPRPRAGRRGGGRPTPPRKAVPRRSGRRGA